MSPKVVVIGLDGLVPEIVFGPQGESLGCLRRLMGTGRWARLTSTHPPISVPAWVSAFTGLDPGELGIYGFRNRPPGTYHMRLATGSWLKARWVWELAADAGLTSVVIGVPLTYPPRATRGVVVSGIPMPPGARDLALPRSIIPRLKRAGYTPDMERFRELEPAEVLAQAWQMATTRLGLWARLLRQWNPELGIVVEMAPDRVHHCLWAHHDPLHPLHKPSSPWRSAVMEHYRLLDRLVDKLIRGLEPETWVIVMSDHGAQTLTGGLAINEWLVAKGQLVLRHRPPTPQPLAPEMVEWNRTRAWAEGGYYARIFLNIAGREPSGVLSPSQAQALAAELKAELEAMEALGNQVLVPSELYRELRGQPPELMLYPAGLKMRAVSTIWPEPPESVILPPGASGLDQANHSMHGLLIVAKAAEALPRAGSELGPCHITQLAPTILKLLGLEPPSWMPPPWPLP